MFKNYALKVQWGADVYLHAFLTLALNGGVRWVSFPGGFTQGMPNEKEARWASGLVWELRGTENFLPWGETNLYSETNQALAQAL